MVLLYHISSLNGSGNLIRDSLNNRKSTPSSCSNVPFRRFIRHVIRPQGILLFRLQALRKILYGIRKQRSEILSPSLLRRPKEPCPCLNPIVNVSKAISPPDYASKECIPSLAFLRTSLHPNGTIFPQKYAITSSSIYRRGGLLSAAEYGNMSDTKEATA